MDEVSAMVWPVPCRDFRGQPAHVTITVNEAAEVVVIAPAPGSFSLDVYQAARFNRAYDEARTLALEMRDRRDS